MSDTKTENRYCFVIGEKEFESFCVGMNLSTNPTVDECRLASSKFSLMLLGLGFPAYAIKSISNKFDDYVFNKIELIENKLKFYKTFVSMMEEKYDLDEQQEKLMRDPGFRKRLTLGHIDARLIIEIAPYYSMLVKKPQKLEADLETGYMAIDMATNTHYYCSNTLMVDVDSYKMPNGDDVDILSILPHCMCQIQQVIENYKSVDDYDPDNTDSRRKSTWNLYKCRNRKKCGRKCTPSCIFRWSVFKSRNGWHAFLLSHDMNPRSQEAIQLLIEAEADLFYIVFSYLRYWSVRLNRKEGEVIGEKGMYPFIGDVIEGKKVNRENKCVPILEHHLFNVNLHINLTKLCEDAPPVFSMGRNNS